ncbi:MAG: hypothetical protein H8D23_06610 [Candidatus Brocadiales bacterium]|nr:hypothetical protein [Candidatus Brocadiales bacterium]
MSITQKDIMKTAASHLRNLSAEVQEFRDAEERRGLVEAILEKTASDISGSEVLEKYSEYMERDLEELKIIDKAIELTKTGELNLGSLSTQGADTADMDALTAMLMEDYL